MKRQVTIIAIEDGSTELQNLAPRGTTWVAYAPIDMNDGFYGIARTTTSALQGVAKIEFTPREVDGNFLGLGEGTFLLVMG